MIDFTFQGANYLAPCLVYAGLSHFNYFIQRIPGPFTLNSFCCITVSVIGEQYKKKLN